MTNTEEWFVQHNLKVGDDLVNIRGRDVAHLRQNVAEYAEAVAEIAQLKANIQGAHSLGQVVQPTNQAQPQQAAPQQQYQSPWGSGGQQQAPAQQAPQQGGLQNGTPHPTGEQCTSCGQVLQYKEVFSKAKNKTFKFWSCPAQRNRDDGHTSKFAN